jgi:site-specific recombinase XerD
MNKDKYILLKKVKYFLTEYLSKEKGASPNTIKSYKETLNQFFGYLQKIYSINLNDITFEMLTKENVVSYLNWLEEVCGTTISTRNQRLACICSFTSQVSASDLALKSQLIDIKEIPFKKNLHGSLPLNYFSDDVLEAILAQPKPQIQKEFRDLFFMSLLYDTAARVQELLDLKPNDIHSDVSQPYAILTGKGSKTRLVPLMPNTVKLFKTYISFFHTIAPIDTNLFYVKYKSRFEPMSQDCVSKFIEKYRIRAKVSCSHIPEHITPHMFRHSRAMSLYRGGMPLPLLSEWLGHKKMETTLTYYANADTKMKKEAIDRATSTFNPLRNKLPEGINADEEQIIKRLYGLQ